MIHHGYVASIFKRGSGGAPVPTAALFEASTLPAAGVNFTAESWQNSYTGDGALNPIARGYVQDKGDGTRGAYDCYIDNCALTDVLYSNPVEYTITVHYLPGTWGLQSICSIGNYTLLGCSGWDFFLLGVKQGDFIPTGNSFYVIRRQNENLSVEFRCAEGTFTGTYTLTASVNNYRGSSIRFGYGYSFPESPTVNEIRFWSETLTDDQVNSVASDMEGKYGTIGE